MKTRIPERKSIGQTTARNNNAEGVFFSILFLNNTRSYSQNTYRKVIVTKCFFGRDESCTIVFSNDDNTVSGRHACIEYDGQHFYLIHLSQSNPTLLNGKEITEIGIKKQLKNNDEIQLSRVGPLFQFKENDSKLSKLTQRFQRFAQTTLRPYKIAIGVLLGVLILALGLIIFQHFKYEPLLQITETIQTQRQADAQKMIELNRQNTNLQLAMKQGFAFNTNLHQPTKTQPMTAATDVQSEVKKMSGSIYLIRAKSINLLFTDGSEQQIEFKKGQGWNGTGFLCLDGRFVTARHVIEPWLYFDKNDVDMIRLNMIATQGGKVTVNFEAQSSNFLTIKFTNHSFTSNTASNRHATGTTATGESVALTKASLQNDWATMKTKYKSGNVLFDAALANNLSQTQTLHVLGYSNGDALQENGKLEPLYSTTTVAQSGTIKGFINVSNRNFEAGASGGPVFANREGQFVAVGIVVSKIGEIGRVVPVSKIGLD
jgi:FHA domain/Trypsin-like peptidase domain